MKLILGIGVALLVAVGAGWAQRKAGDLNQDANALAADAAKTIEDVIGRAAKR